MSDEARRYTRWMSGPTEASVARAAKDQARLVRGRLRDGDATTRYTEAGLARSHYDALRLDRDDLDFREWNEDTGYGGVDRWPTGPGVRGSAPGARTEAQERRARRRREIDDGF